LTHYSLFWRRLSAALVSIDNQLDEPLADIPAHGLLVP